MHLLRSDTRETNPEEGEGGVVYTGESVRRLEDAQEQVGVVGSGGTYYSPFIMFFLFDHTLLCHAHSDVPSFDGVTSSSTRTPGLRTHGYPPPGHTHLTDHAQNGAAHSKFIQTR